MNTIHRFDPAASLLMTDVIISPDLDYFVSSFMGLKMIFLKLVELFK